MALVRHRYDFTAEGLRPDGIVPEHHRGILIVEAANAAEAQVKRDHKLRTTFRGDNWEIRTELVTTFPNQAVA